MRARLALVASAQVCELREVVLSKKPHALLMASAKGTVPVLVTPIGQVVDQSLDIMRWALRKNDPLKWLGAGDSATVQMLQLIERCDGEFKFHLDRYKYPTRYALADAAHHRRLGALYLNDINHRLTQHEFLIGASQSLADMAIAPFIRQFAHTDRPWFGSQPWPDLHSWLAKFERSGIFEQVMQKFPEWVPGQAGVLFPVSTAALSPENVRD